jgi:hypothetical protein
MRSSTFRNQSKMLIISIAAASGTHGSPTLMATIPPNTVPGISEELRVFEDLSVPNAPIMFEGAVHRFALAKSAEAQMPIDADALWGGFGIDRIQNDPSDLLGNQLLAKAAEPTYDAIANLVPPVLSSAPSDCGDYKLQAQTFVGSRTCAQKHLFLRNGEMHNLDSPLEYHLETGALSSQNMSSGLVGGCATSEIQTQAGLA